MANFPRWSTLSGAALCAALLAGTAGPAAAAMATACVNPQGSKGCFSTIGAAVAAAAPGDTINVGQGTYREQVIIGKPLSLIGANAANTVVDASGNANGVGIYVDGMDNIPVGLSEVVVQGFTVANALFEGILVTNASNVTITGNQVTGNNRGLSLPPPGCSGLPLWETSEGFDCGEGIHLNAVDHSIVANNMVDHNAGGILLTDETGPTHDNMITGNLVTENGYECGITLASHRPASGSVPFGVFHNTVANNESSKNGLIIPGTGVGIGLFTSPGNPNTATYGNVIINNRVTGNGHPGVALHSHRSTHNLTDNAIIGNYIAGNGADTNGPSPTATPAPTGINLSGVSALTGTIVSGNVIEQEDIDVAVHTPAQIDIHMNDLRGEGIGVDILATPDRDAGTANATQNWWGCSGGPQAPGCSGVQGAVTFAPWLTTPATGSDNAPH